MPVIPPQARVQVDFNVSGHRRVVPDTNHRSAKVRTGLLVPESRMKNLRTASVEGEEFMAQKPLLEPDLLEQPFRRRAFGCLPEDGTGKTIQPRYGIAMGWYLGHLAVAF